jgi:mono/diheme cytochrome c family protein
MGFERKLGGAAACLTLVLMGAAAAAAFKPAGGSAVNGRKLYLRENCYGCHGGRGGGGMCPSLRRDRPDDDSVIREGTPTGMPAFGQRLTEQEIVDLIAYIQSLRTDAEPTFTHWWEAVPSQ